MELQSHSGVTATGGNDGDADDYTKYSRDGLIELVKEMIQRNHGMAKLVQDAIDKKKIAEEKVLNGASIASQQRRQIACQLDDERRKHRELYNRLESEKVQAIENIKAEYSKKSAALEQEKKNYGSKFEEEYLKKNKEFEEKKREFCQQLQNAIERNRKEIDEKRATYVQEVDKEYQQKHKELEKELKVVRRQKEEYELTLKNSECPQCPNKQKELDAVREECDNVVKTIQKELKAKGELITILEKKIGEFHGVSSVGPKSYAVCVKCNTPLLKSTVPCQFPTTKTAVCLKCFKEKYPDVSPLFIAI